MKQGKTLVELATEIERQAEHKQDFVVKSQVLRMHTGPDNGSRLALSEGEGYGEYSMSDLAHKQIGQHLGIPATYYSKLRAEHPALLDQNVNTLVAATLCQPRR